MRIFQSYTIYRHRPQQRLFWSNWDGKLNILFFAFFFQHFNFKWNTSYSIKFHLIFIFDFNQTIKFCNDTWKFSAKFYTSQNEWFILFLYGELFAKLQLFTRDVNSFDRLKVSYHSNFVAFFVSNYTCDWFIVGWFSIREEYWKMFWKYC